VRKKIKVKHLIKKFPLSLLLILTLLVQNAQSSKGVWCWGHNQYGQLGDGTTTHRLTPVQVQNLSDVVQVTEGFYHTCALKEDGTVWCWGRNSEGQLGDGTTTNRLTPVQVNNLSGVVQITAGDLHTCAVKQDGTVWCWGYNRYGQLGDGTTTNRLTPVQVKNLSNVVQIAAGHLHTCALKQDGTVWCWGNNSDGQLGDGTTTNRYTPVQVQNLTGVVQVAAGYVHTCALKQDSTIWCWGNNSYGQLGDGTTNDRLTPVKANILGSRITAGGWYTCTFSQSGGTVWCWGENYYGQFGDGTTAILKTSPVMMKHSGGTVQAATGHWHTCVLKQDGTVWCCGWNGYGQLGDGTTTNRYTLVQVPGLVAESLFDYRSVGGYAHSCVIATINQITLFPESISFTRPGETRTVTVDNSGVTITSVTSSDPEVFQIKNNTCINSSQDCSFDVVFRPGQLIDYTGTVTVSYSGGSKTVSLQALLSRTASAPIVCPKLPILSQIERKPKMVFVIITRVGRCK